MTRGGKRIGAGRPPVKDKKINRCFRLYEWEIEKVKEFIKQLRKDRK